MATGLMELIEMRNGGKEDGPTYRLTLSNQADPHCELSVITLVDGASLILRPSFLADIERGGPAETDLLAGTVVRLGQRHGVPTPIHDVATAAFEAATQPTA